MKIFASTFLAAFLVANCGGVTVQPNTAASARATARAAVTVAASGFVIAANACLAASEASPGKGIAATCAKYLDPAHDLIVEAAQAVDGTWSAQAACDLTQAVSLATK